MYFGLNAQPKIQMLNGLLLYTLVKSLNIFQSRAIGGSLNDTEMSGCLTKLLSEDKENCLTR